MIDTDKEWDQEGSIGFIRDRDTMVVPSLVPLQVVVQTSVSFKVEVATLRPKFIVMIAPYLLIILKLCREITNSRSERKERLK